MGRIIENEKLPWPSRLAGWSCRCVMLGMISIATAILLAFIVSSFPAVAETIDAIFEISFFICFGVFVIAFFAALMLSLLSLIGMAAFHFRIPRKGLAVGVFIPALIVFTAEVLFVCWVIPEARRSICGSNVRELNASLYWYRNEEGKLPDKEKWNDLIQPFFTDENYFQCTADNVGPCSYAMNENIPTDAEDLSPDLVVLFESTPGWNHVGGIDEIVTNRHNGCWVSFGDSHIEFVEPEDIPALRWTMENKSVERQ